MTAIADDKISLRLTHSCLKTFGDVVTFSTQTTVDSVKQFLWKKCGTSPSSMRLELHDTEDQKLYHELEDKYPLSHYSPLPSYRLHVVDLHNSVGCWLEDTTLIEKYSISEEAYSNREDTFRKFKEQIAPRVSSFKNKATDENSNTHEACQSIKVGDRCEVEIGGMKRRGVVKYVGVVKHLPHGCWIGVQYDEPLGKHDGVVNGVRYFECPTNHGAMVKAKNVKVGEYPEIDPIEDEEI